MAHEEKQEETEQEEELYEDETKSTEGSSKGTFEISCGFRGQTKLNLI